MELDIFGGQYIPPLNPIYKYPGGKRGGIPFIRPRIPSSIDFYWEPFFGAGAVFFHFHNRIKEGILSDIDINIIKTLLAIDRAPEKIGPYLEIHAKNHSREYYKKIRDKKQTSDAARAGAYLYMRSFSFGAGLNDTSNRNQYGMDANAAWSDASKSPSHAKRVHQEKNNLIKKGHKLKTYALVLKKMKIVHGCYKSIDILTKDRVLVYIDPPYYIDKDKRQLYANGFSETDQKDLMRAIDLWHKKGCSFLYSNRLNEMTQGFASKYSFATREFSKGGGSMVKQKNGKFKRLKLEEIMIWN